ncbi:ATP-binding protein, partial [Streptomyces sp. CB01881]|uniref:sensor histidine kinase n=1 Tax=Streptomyces sp. CB01881 TaxID=2078691 RepID=UPI001F4F7379
ALTTLARGDLVQLDAFRSVDLAEAADAAVREAARRHPQAAFTADVPDETRVFGWEPGLRIMLANLLDNAAVHGRTGQEPAQATLRLVAEDGAALLTVDDRGPGIGPAERESVFRRFERRRDSPGSGLGLTLVAQQVALHRGTIRITTPPGGDGCRMEIRLPSPRPDAPTVELPAGRDWISGPHH